MTRGDDTLQAAIGLLRPQLAPCTPLPQAQGRPTTPSRPETRPQIRIPAANPNPNAGRHWRRPANAMLREYGLNAFKSLARSHPAVFAAHHPDLLVEEDGQVVRRSAA